jgi:hypothetical protein
MFFLLRTTFWLGLVLLIMPIDTSEVDSEGRQISAFETVLAAQGAAADIVGLCDRRPDVCDTGSALLETVGTRALQASKMAYEYLDEQFGVATPATDPVETATIR